MTPRRSKSRAVAPGQIWSRYSIDGKRRLTGYMVRRVDGDIVIVEPVNIRGRAIGPRVALGRDFLERYYLEPRTAELEPETQKECQMPGSACERPSACERTTCSCPETEASNG